MVTLENVERVIVEDESISALVLVCGLAYQYANQYQIAGVKEEDRLAAMAFAKKMMILRIVSRETDEGG